MRKKRIANRNPVVLEVIKKRYYTYKDLGFYDYDQLIRAAQQTGIEVPKRKNSQIIRFTETTANILQQHKI